MALADAAEVLTPEQRQRLAEAHARTIARRLSRALRGPSELGFRGVRWSAWLDEPS